MTPSFRSVSLRFGSVAVWLVVAMPLSCAAADFTGQVVNVHDGDTLTVLVDRNQVRVRLTDIDAPELGQAFGKRSKDSLADICAGKSAFVIWKSKDRYHRTLGRVSCANVDANSEQVRRGMAWVYERYAPKNSPLYKVESRAREQGLGLWADPWPVAPWEWRKGESRTSR